MSALFDTMRFRLTLWYTVVLSVILCAFGLVTYVLMRHQLVRHHDGALWEAAAQVTRVLAQQEDCVNLTAGQRAELDRLGHVVLFHEMGGQNRLLYRSPDSADTRLPFEKYSALVPETPDGRFDRIQSGNELLRMYSVPFRSRAGRPGVIHVVEGLGNILAPLTGLRLILLVMAPIAVVVSAAGGYWLARRALAPVDDVTRLAREIGAGNLARRLPVPKVHDEIGRLVDTLNQMIGRLEASFEGIRRFTGDAAHELRGPLTTMKGAIEVALSRDRESSQYRAALASVGEDVERLRSISEDLLVLARADAGHLELVKAPLRLDVVAAEVVESLSGRAAGRGVSLSARCATPVVALGDERWLRQLILNLCDNAIKFSAPGSGAAAQARVEVEVLVDNGAVRLDVVDSGPGIPEGAIGRIFERFFRADEARGRGLIAEGSGLGLPIAAWIAQAHGGRISAENRTGGGARFSVSLPLAG